MLRLMDFRYKIYNDTIKFERNTENNIKTIVKMQRIGTTTVT